MKIFSGTQDQIQHCSGRIEEANQDYYCFWFVALPNRLDRANLPVGRGTEVIVGVLSSSHF